ncbi:MAG: PIN domain-containing protein [Cytophagales bacterium]
MILANDLFVDSNVILYLLDAKNNKSQISKEILGKHPNINAQVLVEVVNVCKRKFGYSKSECISLWKDICQTCEIVPIAASTLKLCGSLVEKYDFQLFDSIIVASALESDCDILCSEDMHHTLLVEERLTIINPFL